METTENQETPRLVKSLSTTSSPTASTGAKTRRRRNDPDSCCMTCRLRKVKCSGRSDTGPCKNCSRLNLSCSFAQAVNASHRPEKVSRTTPNGIVTEAGTLRKRAQRACKQCHTHKTKCSGDLPRCSRCDINNLACEYVPAKRKFANVPGHSNALEVQVASSATSVTSASTDTTSNNPVGQEINKTPTTLEFVLGPSTGPQTLLIKRDFLITHVKAYFDYFYYMPCMGFLHPNTVYKSIEDDTLSPYLAAAICSITATLVSTVDAGRALAARCNEHVEYFLFRNFGELEEDLLVYHVLATIYNWMSGPLGKVWCHVSNAARLIRCRNFNYDTDYNPGQGTSIQQETRRRCVWKIYLIDHFLSRGFQEHLLLPSGLMHLRLPASEHAFKEGLPNTMDTLDGCHILRSNPGEYSLDACHIRLMTIRSQILTSPLIPLGSPILNEANSATNKFANPSQNTMVLEQILELIRPLQNALDIFGEGLPENVKLSMQNIQAHLYRPDRACFVMLHTWFAVSHCELYLFSLPNAKEAGKQDWAANIPWDYMVFWQQQAVEYAISMVFFWTSFHQMIDQHSSLNRGIATVDWMLGACAVEVASIILSARKFRLYDNFKEEFRSSAFLFHDHPIDDALLTDLVERIIKLLDSLRPYLPRIQGYIEHLLNKIKEYDEDPESNQFGTGLGPLIVTSNPNLPGPDNLARYVAEQPSLSPSIDPSFDNIHAHHNTAMGSLSANWTPSLDASSKSTMTSVSALSTPTALGNYHEVKEISPFQMQMPTMMSQNDGKIYDPYALPSAFQNAELQGGHGMLPLHRNSFD